MYRILFVCTGNIFRSLTAEYALRQVWGARSDIMVASAGTEDFPHVVNPYVEDYLLTRGLDVSRHYRRTLTAQILEEPGPVIAMSTEHRSVLAERFNRRACLYSPRHVAFLVNRFLMWMKPSGIIRRTPSR
jgi:protein-tyrosine phosphatase